MAEDRGAGISRRSALRGAALSAGALALARPAFASAQDSGDDPSELLFEAIEISYALVLAYDPAAAVSDQPRADAETLGRFSVQSKAHADAFENAFELTSADELPEVPTSVGDSELLDDLPTAPTRDEFVAKLVELEAQLISLLLEGAADRQSPSLVRTFGEIASNCAQHQAVLRQLTGEKLADVVPEAILEPAAPDTASTPPEDSGS